MNSGKMSFVIDAMHGSSGKGKISTYLADKHSFNVVSSANFPNAGHSAIFDIGIKFVSKAIPTSAILKKANHVNMTCLISPGSGFKWEQLIKEWVECGFPKIIIHSRASVVTDLHTQREREGSDSTKHIASTMQGSATALSDKILRRKGLKLAGDYDLFEVFDEIKSPDLENLKLMFMEQVTVVDAMEFRNITHSYLESGNNILHEGSQGYALSIDHGSHYPASTSRNCSTQAAMDYMAVPASKVGDVILNLRTYPIRVGNVVENGVVEGYSGDFYPDSKELTWDEVAKLSGMPDEEAQLLTQRELTTVTKRLRRVSTFSYVGLADAVRTNGATSLSVNFIQYINWQDNKLRGGVEAFNKLSKESRKFLDSVENASGIPVVLIGTGPNHEDIIDLT